MIYNNKNSNHRGIKVNIKASIKRDLPAVTIFLILSTIFYLAKLPGGDDWETFYGAAQRVISGISLYGTKITHAYYSNPPWLAAILAPFGLLPQRVGLAVLLSASLLIIVALVRRYNGTPAKMAFVILSPAMLYILLHGEIDAVFLGGILLAREWWPIVAITKPQVAIALVFGIGKATLLRASVLICTMILISLIAFGGWPVALLHQPAPFVGSSHNLWLGLWPFQVPAGILLLLLGVERKDELLLLAASPFLSPYAAMSSMIGPWLAATLKLKPWQSAIILTAWWGATIYRAIVQGI